MPENINVSSSIQGYFCSDTVFNLSKKVFKIKLLGKGLHVAHIQNKTNEPELRKDFEEFCWRMRIKWHFRIDVTPQISEIPAFTPTSKWKPPKGNLNSEVFLSRIQKELFELTETPLGYSNFSEKEWQALRSLANDRSTVIKKSDKRSYVIVWDREDYIADAERQLGDKNVYKDIDFKEKILQELTETSNSLFRKLKKKVCVTEKELKY